MTRNPFYNAGCAMLYIGLVVTIMNIASKWATERGGDNILMPIGMLSLFVLSAAITSYIFLYQPISLFLDGKRREALNLFWHTIAVFAGLAVIVVLVSFTFFR